MANVDIRVGKKDAVFFSANPTLILKDGQFLFNSDTLELFIGDGTSQLSALVAINVPPSSGVQSVTGANVDNTDPLNPIVNNLGLIQIVDKAGEFFTDLATASAYIRTMWVTPPTITNESFDSGVYYFTVPSGTIIEGYFLTDTVGGLPNNASVIDQLGLLVEFQSGANFVLNSGNHILGNCIFADSDFYQFTGNVFIKNIVDIFTTLGNSFAEFSTGKFIIEGNIGPLETAQYTPFFRNSTSTIFVNAGKYTSNSGAIHGDLQNAIANGCNVQFDGIDKLSKSNNLSDVSNRFTSRNNLGLYDNIITTGNQSTAVNTSTDITGLSFAAAANKRYEIDGKIRFQCSGNGGGKFEITLPSDATMDVILHGFSSTGTAYTFAVLNTSGVLSAVAFAAVTGGNLNCWVTFKGEIKMDSTAGNIVVGFASATNGQTTTINQLGTIMKYRQLN